MAIGVAMAEEFTHRYGIPFRPFQNAVEVPLERPRLPDRPHNAPLRLLYVGGLHLGRWESLKEIASALPGLLPDRLAACRDLRPSARPRAPDGAVLTGTPALKVVGSLRAEEVPRVLSDADVLVHVESFDPAARRYTRLSVSTKIPSTWRPGERSWATGPVSSPRAST